MTLRNKKPSVTVERRRRERISANLAAALTIGLVMDDGTVRGAVPVDISAGGVCLQWSPGDAVALDVGERVALRLQPCTADAAVTVDAVVRWLGTDDDGHIRCGLEFEDVYKIFADVMPSLWTLCHALHGQR